MQKYIQTSFFLFISVVCSAQQNLFNIPSGDITPAKKLFYQQQFNFYQIDELESKSHFVYGLGKGWDAGLNFIDLPLKINDQKILSFNDNSNRKPLYPLLMASLQKQWQIASHWQINLGIQAGPNLSNNINNKKIAYFNYAVVRWSPLDKAHLLAGSYYTNNVFVGGPPERQIGFMAGYEYKLSKKLLLMGDFISGHHKKSQTVIGAGYTFGNRIQLFLGGLLAFPNRALQNGLVVELNWYGWDFMKK